MRKVIFILILCFEFLLFGENLIILPPKGDIVEDKKIEVKEKIKEIFKELHYNIVEEWKLREALRENNLAFPLSLEEVLFIGERLKGDFLVEIELSPMTGQYQVKITLIDIKERVIKEEQGLVIEEEKEKEKLKEIVLMALSKKGERIFKEGKKERGEVKKEKREEQKKEILLLPPKPTLKLEERKDIAIESYGNKRIRIGGEIGLGINLTEPPIDNRLNGHITVSSGYIINPRWLWLEIKGELSSVFGNTSAFYIDLGFRIRKALLKNIFLVGGLGFGFFKAISVTKRDSFLFKIEAEANYRINRSWEILFSPLGFEIISGNGDTVVLYLILLGINYYL